MTIKEDKLYTDRFIASLPEVVPFRNPWLVGFCKFDGHAESRELIEKWYSGLPDAVKLQFKHKLLSVDDDVFIPAFHELSIYRFCQEEGWEIEYEPALKNGLTPDLIVDTKKWGKVAIEVTTVFDVDGIKLGEKRSDMLTRKIALIETDIVLGITHNGYPQKNFKPAKAAADVKDWLETINGKGKHTKTFDTNGCSFTISVDPSMQRHKPSVGCVLTVSSGGSVPDYSEKIKRKLKSKRKKYSSKNIGMPLIVVLADGVGQYRVDAHAIDKALFGQFTFTIDISGDEAGKFGRDRTGHFTPSNDKNGVWSGKNTGMSSVMFSSYEGGGKFHMRLFNNPFAECPLPFEPFKIIPQLIATELSPNITLKWVVGEIDNHLDKPEQYTIIFK